MYMLKFWISLHKNRDLTSIPVCEGLKEGSGQEYLINSVENEHTKNWGWIKKWGCGKWQKKPFNQ